MTDKGDKPKNEIRVSQQTRLGAALRYAYSVIEKEGQDTIIIRGAGQAIQTVVPLAELIRHRVKGLHQNTEITTMQIEEFRAPREGGEKRTFVRTLIMLKVTLSKQALDKKSPGYTAPLPDSEIVEYVDAPQHEGEQTEGTRGTRGSRGSRGTRGDRGSRGGRGTRGSRGGRGARGGRRDDYDADYPRDDYKPRGSTRGRGLRGGRGSRGARGGAAAASNDDGNWGSQ